VTTTPPAADAVARVLDAVDAQRESAVGLLAHLVGIPSIGGTPAEVQIQHEAAELLRDAGLDVETWDIDLDAVTSDPAFPGQEVERTAAVGVVGTLRGTGGGRSLLLDGHTDVVPPGAPGAWIADPFVMRREEVDGVETLLGRGTFELVRRGVRADVCIIPEPTDLDIVPANGGALTFRLRVPGRAVHASRRTEGVSAIEKFIPVFHGLHDLEGVRNAVVHPLMQRWRLAYPLSIGTVHAGDWASTVPDLLVAEGRLGVALEESPDAARRALEDAVAALCDADDFLREHPVQVEWWGGQFAPGLSTDASLIDLVKGAHRTAAPDAREQEVYGGPYGSDLRLLAPHMPVLQYGPGDARHAHAPIEQVRTDDMMTTARALVLAILAHCGPAA